MYTEKYLSILKTKNVSRLEKLINRAMQVKNDLRNNDLESFKNIVNSTNDTHNKLISSIQKNVDQMIRLVKRSLRTRWWSELHRDKSGQEGVTTALEEKISKISALRWELELWEHTIFQTWWNMWERHHLLPWSCNCIKWKLQRSWRTGSEEDDTERTRGEMFFSNHLQ